ncbi:alcohol dehydrogenase catalytic domain-containing protein [Amnibacterium kyonggiense]
MRAIVMRRFGTPGVLHLEEIDRPKPAVGEALVRVAAVEVARTRDVATRGGEHPFSRQVRLPHVLGGDCAGVVAEVGPGGDTGLVGQRVAAMNTHTCGRCAACRAGREYECTELRMVGIHRPGAYADFVAVPTDSLFALPDAIAMTEAAALAATGPIALTQLRTVAVGAGGSVLVPGITGALATTIAALAGRLGVHVVGSTRRPVLAPPGLGVDLLDPAALDFEESLRAAASGGVDGVIDNVGAPALFDRYFAALRNGSRIVVSGALDEGAAPVVRVPLGALYVRSLALVGVRTATARAVREFWDLVSDGFRLPPGLIRTIPLDQAAQAHELIERGDAVAHTVLVVDEGAP